MKIKSRMKIHTILEEGNYNGQDLDEDEDKDKNRDPTTEYYVLVLKYIIVFAVIAVIGTIVGFIYIM
jgi:hypothetical protein